MNRVASAFASIQELVAQRLRLRPETRFKRQIPMSNNRFNFKAKRKPASLQGKLLVASPVLDDSPFRKTVVLLLQHNDAGSFGVVLNRPAGEKILRAWDDIAGRQKSNSTDFDPEPADEQELAKELGSAFDGAEFGDDDFGDDDFGDAEQVEPDAIQPDSAQEITNNTIVRSNIVHGGPVGGPVFAIHELESIGEMEMPGGIFVSAQSDNLMQLVHNHNDRYKIVFGVAAWGEGQLQSEIDQGCWFPVSATADHVFASNEWMWEQQLRRYGRELTRDVFGLTYLPGDPQLN